MLVKKAAERRKCCSAAARFLSTQRDPQIPIRCRGAEVPAPFGNQPLQLKLVL
jgi:hypothetical protein